MRSCIAAKRAMATVPWHTMTASSHEALSDIENRLNLIHNIPRVRLDRAHSARQKLLGQRERLGHSNQKSVLVVDRIDRGRQLSAARSCRVSGMSGSAAESEIS